MLDQSKIIKWFFMLLLLGLLIYLVDVTSHMNNGLNAEQQFLAQDNQAPLHPSQLKIEDDSLKKCAMTALYQNRFSNENTGLNSLEQIVNLKQLYCQNQNIRSLAGIAQLEGLETLNVSGNEISYIGSIQWLKNLQSLNLNNNNVTDIASLVYLEQLNTLHLAGNEIDNYEIINELPLRYIELPNLKNHRCIFVRHFINSLEMKTKPSKNYAKRRCKY